MPRHEVHTQLRLGSVSFLNAKPLIYGLDEEPNVELTLHVPSRLADLLRDAVVDVALLPVIDYQRLEGLRLIPAGGIASDGATLTVRIFSKQPIAQINELACDWHSHTSVALAYIIMQEKYGRTIKLRELPDAAADDDVPRLLIGDKVITREPGGFPYQLDLGEAWKELTGLPFVFAAWMARPDFDLGDWPLRLKQAKREGMANIETILSRHAGPLGWPLPVARRYLTEHLRFDIGQREIDAIERFHRMAAIHGLIDGPVQPLRLVTSE